MDEAGNLARSEALAREATPLVADAVVRARLAMLRGRLLMTAGRVEEGHALLLAEVESVTELDSGLAAAMLCFAANLPFFRLDATMAVDLAERARALGPPHRARTPSERNAFAMAKTMAGDPEGPSLLVELAVEAARNVAVGHRLGASIGWPLGG